MDTEADGITRVAILPALLPSHLPGFAQFQARRLTRIFGEDFPQPITSNSPAKFEVHGIVPLKLAVV